MPTDSSAFSRESSNRYGVEVFADADTWTVRITDTEGAVAAERACRDETEARTYASTVRQHIYWLSEERFRRYYRLGEPLEA